MAGGAQLPGIFPTYEQLCFNIYNLCVLVLPVGKVTVVTPKTLIYKLCHQRRQKIDGLNEVEDDNQDIPPFEVNTFENMELSQLTA